MKNLYALLILFVGATCTVEAQIAAGGNYKLDQSVVATGGGASSAGTFKIEGTTAQAIAGTNSTGPNSTFKGGFWTVQPLAPTAASLSIRGRITRADGTGVRNVSVTLSGLGGAPLTALTGSFGYYEFAQIEAGQTVVISVSAKRLTFAQPTMVLNITEDMSGIDFISNEN
jgi:NADPH-dependent curcumin reductase CurA